MKQEKLNNRLVVPETFLEEGLRWVGFIKSMSWEI